MMTESLTAAQPGPIASVCQIVLILLKWELQDLFSIISSILSLLDAFKDICELFSISRSWTWTCCCVPGFRPWRTEWTGVYLRGSYSPCFLLSSTAEKSEFCGAGEDIDETRSTSHQ